MPRIARKKSDSNMYHIMLRGINRQDIFEDDEDKEKFLSVIKECKTICGFKLFAYCLMDNHVHLLLKIEKEEIDLVFRRIGTRYVYWYNWKYRRVGHLFQDRFKSEPVENERYFLAVIRYIHQNPVVAQLAKTVDNYYYSSYAAYMNKSHKLIDTQFIFDMISKDEFIRFHQEENKDKCMDLVEKDFRLTEVEAAELISKISNCSIAEIQLLVPEDQRKYLKAIHKRGVSIRQIARLTGISKGMVEKSLK